MHSISKPPSLSEQLADLLAEDFSIVEYIELVVDGYQFWHSQVHYYDIWLRRDYWPDVGWGQQLIGLDVRESFLLQRAIAAENMVERRASWVATLEENRVIRDKVSMRRAKLNAEC